MSKDWSATYYQNIKERLQKQVKDIKKTVKDMEVFLKKSWFYLKWITFPRNDHVICFLT